QLQRGGDQHSLKEGLPREPARLTGIRVDEDREYIKTGVLRESGPHRQQQVPWVVPNQIKKRHLASGALRSRPGEAWGLQDVEANEQARPQQHHSREERHPPAPAQKLLRG